MALTPVANCEKARGKIRLQKTGPNPTKKAGSGYGGSGAAPS
jgi:hypothetical protein